MSVLFLFRRALSVLRASTYDLKQTIVLNGSPRSGTTWVEEVIAHDLHMRIVWEPFNIAIGMKPPPGFALYTYWANGERCPEAIRFTHAVLTGRQATRHHRWPRHSTTPFSLTNKFLSEIGPRRYLVKTTRIGGILPWLCQHYPQVRVVHLVRSPYAVIASQLAMHAPQPVTLVEALVAQAGGYELISPAFFAAHPQLRPYWGEQASEAQRLAVLWCVGNSLLLDPPDASNLLVLRYETLVQQGSAAMRDIFAFIHEPVPADLAARLGRHSRVTNEKTAQAVGRLDSWRERLDAQQVADIRAVVSAFGLPEYVTG